MESLGIDTNMIIAQMINFALVFFIFIKYISPHVTAFIKKRQEEEKKSESLIKELEEQKQAIEKERQEVKAQLKKERSELLALATKEAEKVKEELMSKNQKEIDTMIERSKLALKQERIEFEKELKENFTHAIKQTLEKSFQEVLPKTSQKEVLEHIAKQ